MEVWAACALVFVASSTAFCMNLGGPAVNVQVSVSVAKYLPWYRAKLMQCGSSWFLTGLTFWGYNSVKLSIRLSLKLSESDFAKSRHFGCQKYPALNCNHFADTAILKACLRVELNSKFWLVHPLTFSFITMLGFFLHI